MASDAEAAKVQIDVLSAEVSVAREREVEFKKAVEVRPE